MHHLNLALIRLFFDKGDNYLLLFELGLNDKSVSTEINLHLMTTQALTDDDRAFEFTLTLVFAFHFRGASNIFIWT